MKVYGGHPKFPKLVCVPCGRKAHLVAHGVSYCKRCFYEQGGSNYLRLKETSPAYRKPA